MGRTTDALLFKESLDGNLENTLASCKEMEKMKKQTNCVKQLQQLHAPQHSNQVALPRPLHLQPLIESEQQKLEWLFKTCFSIL